MIQCHKRYLNLTNQGDMASKPWCMEEDEILRKVVQENGAKNWSKIAQSLPGRIGK